MPIPCCDSPELPGWQAVQVPNARGDGDASISRRSTRRGRGAAAAQCPLVGKYLGDRDPLVVLESARAIHDVPIVEAFPALAELMKQPVPEGENGDALFRRVLNANFHLGSIDSARGSRILRPANSRFPIPCELTCWKCLALGQSRPGAIVCWACGGRLSLRYARGGRRPAAGA